MFDFLKKIGLPAGVAAVIAAVITAVPFLFKLDERYAKAEELENEVKTLQVKIDALASEVSNVRGMTGVILAFTTKNAPVVQPQEPVKLAPAVPGSELKVEQVEVPAIPENPTPHEWKDVLGQVKKGLEQSQRNIEQIQKY